MTTGHRLACFLLSAWTAATLVTLVGGAVSASAPDSPGSSEKTIIRFKEITRDDVESLKSQLSPIKNNNASPAELDEAVRRLTLVIFF